MTQQTVDQWTAAVYPMVLPIVRTQLVNRQAKKAIEAILTYFRQEGYESDAIGPALIKSRLKLYLPTIDKAWVEPPKVDAKPSAAEEATQKAAIRKQAVDIAIASLNRLGQDVYRLSKQGLNASDVAQKCGIEIAIAREYITLGRIAESAAFQRLTAKPT